jgi:anti-sigma-K factor RskA
MKDSLKIIEAYFEGSLPIEERGFFEERCVNDVDFAAEVAGYISM